MTDPVLWPVVAIFAVLLLLLAAGVWVGLSLIGSAVFALWLLTDVPIGDAMATTVWSATTGWSLTSLPLFILMGEILFRTNVTNNLFAAISPWVSNLPGRLLHVNVLACTLFAAISGSSAATCATVGRISCDELKQRGYPDKLITGSLAGASTLGLLIPPSIVMIVYGVAAEVSISKLFLAGVFPGLLLALCFMGLIALFALLDPQQIPEKEPSLSLTQKLRSSAGLAAPLLLVLAVLGSIYTGIATPTQAAVIGVCGALAVAWLDGGLTSANITASLLGATSTSAIIMLIIMGSSFLSLAMGFTGIPDQLAQWISQLELSKYGLLLALTFLFIALGCFLDGISMILLTMSVVLPIVKAAGFDLIWFGIYLVLVIEIAQITPPVGINLYVLQGITRQGIGTIARAALPNFALITLVIVIITLVPELVLFLPKQMY
ncbi:MAG: TRAP transporter large permease [Pseudomonadales bacterium]